MQVNCLFGSQFGTDGRVVVLGLPFDHGSEAPSGCSEAPQVLRSLSSHYRIQQEGLHDSLSGRPLLLPTDISDIGDLKYKVRTGSVAYFASVTEISAELLSANKRLFTIGGDHLLTLPIIEGIDSLKNDFQILQIDAHSDYQELRNEEFASHSSFMYRIESLKTVKRIVHIGLRGFERSSGISSKKILRFGSNDVVSAVLALDPNLPVYITIDSDGFDPSLIPAVNFPIHDGISVESYRKLLSMLSDRKLSFLGADWMEYNPVIDSKNHLAGRFILDRMVELLMLIKE